MGNRASRSATPFVDLTKLDEASIQKLWEKYDKAKTGYLGKTEVQDLVRDWCVQHRVKESNSQLQEFWTRVDTDKDGKISKSELIASAKQAPTEPQPEIAEEESEAKRLLEDNKRLGKELKKLHRLLNELQPHESKEQASSLEEKKPEIKQGEEDGDEIDADENEDEEEEDDDEDEEDEEEEEGAEPGEEEKNSDCKLDLNESVGKAKRLFRCVFSPTMELPTSLRLFSADEKSLPLPPTLAQDSQGTGYLTLPPKSYLAVSLPPTHATAYTVDMLVSVLATSSTPAPCPLIQLEAKGVSPLVSLRLTPQGALLQMQNEVTARSVKSRGRYTRITLMRKGDSLSLLVNLEVVPFPELEKQVLGSQAAFGVAQVLSLFRCASDYLVQVRRIEVYSEALSTSQLEGLVVKKSGSKFDRQKRVYLRGLGPKLFQYKLTKRPSPIWQTPPFVAEFCDPFLAGTGMDGGDCFDTLKFLLEILKVLLDEGLGGGELTPAEIDKFRCLVNCLTTKENILLFKKIYSLADADSITKALLRKVVSTVYDLRPGQWLLLPAGYKPDPDAPREFMMIMVHRPDEKFTLDFALVITGPGKEFLQAVAQNCAPCSKMWVRGTTIIPNIPRERMADPSFWLMALNQYATGQSAKEWFRVLLPWLAQQPLETLLAQSNQHPSIDLRTMQYSSTDFYTTLKHSLMYALRRSGWSKNSTKLFSLSLRRTMASVVMKELGVVKRNMEESLLTEADRLLLEMMRSQIGMSVIKLGEREGEDSKMVPRLYHEILFDCMLENRRQLSLQFTPSQDGSAALSLAKVLKRAKLDSHELASLYAPFLLSDRPWQSHPLVDCFLPSDIAGKEGATVPPPRQRPLNFFLIEKAVASFGEACHVLTQLLLLLDRIDNLRNVVKCFAHLKVCLLQHVFTRVIPIPLGPEQRALLPSGDPVWDPGAKGFPLLHAQRVWMLETLKRCTEHFVTAVFSQSQNRILDGVRIIVVGAIAAMADAMMRCETLEPAPLSDSFAGRIVQSQEVEGSEPKRWVFKTSTELFAKQAMSTLAFSPELVLAKTRILDYFHEIKANGYVMSWELEKLRMETEQTTLRWLRTTVHVSYGEILRYQECDVVSGRVDLITSLHPEFVAYRDINFYWKYLLIPAPNTAFPSYANVGDEPFMGTSGRLDWTSTNPSNRNAEDVKLFGVFKIFETILQHDEARNNLIHGQRYPSAALPSSYTKEFQAVTEDDILHIPVLDGEKFDRTLTQQDLELLLSFLTVPYIRIPLLLNFISLGDRMHALRSENLRDLIESALFEPGRYLSIDNARIAPELVPASSPDTIASPFSYLFQELSASPKAVWLPIVRLNEASKAMKGSVYASNVDIIFFLARLSARTLGMARCLLTCCRSTHPSIRTPMRWGGLYVDDNKVPLEVASSVLQELAEGMVEVRRQHLDIYCSMFNGWLEELRQSRGNGKESLDQLTERMNNIHAHLILLYSNAFDPPSWLSGENERVAQALQLKPLTKEETDEVIPRLMLSTMWLTTKHTWDRNMEDTPAGNRRGNGIAIPEIELFDHVHQTRRAIIDWMDAHTKKGQQGERFQAALTLIYHNIIEVKNDSTNINWGFVRSSQGGENLGRYAAMNFELEEKGLGPQALPDTALAVEINFQTMQLLLNSQTIQALDQGVAMYTLVCKVLERSPEAKVRQCIHVSKHNNRQCWYLLTEKLLIERWMPHNEFPPVSHFSTELDRDYDEQLGEEEGWIKEIFEPIRKRYFVAGRAFGPNNSPLKKDLIFNLPLDEYSADDRVAVMGIPHPLTPGKRWKEVVVLREWKVVHIYGLIDQGRRYYRKLEYTSDANICLNDLQPGQASRMPEQSYGEEVAGYQCTNPCSPWPEWGRREAYLAMFENSFDPSEFSPPSQLTSLVIRRLLPGVPQFMTEAVSWSKDDEILMDEQCLYGVIPSALLSVYEFWQDGHRLIFDPDVDEGTVKPQLLRGYPRKTTTESVIFVELDAFNEETSSSQPFPSINCRITRRKVEQKELDTAGRPRAVLFPPAATQHHEVLINLMYAAKGSQEFQLATLFSKIETLAYVLCWARAGPNSSGDLVTFNRIELPRLRLTFEARPSADGTLRIWSVDHSHLFIDIEQSVLGHRLFRNISHSLVLRSESEDQVVLVPNLSISRPRVRGQPFSVHVVLDRSNTRWARNSTNAFYLYPIHVSNSFAFSMSLEAELYLLANLILTRDYAEAFKVAGRIATDIELTPEGEQALDIVLKNAPRDGHPNASAVMARIYLQLVDSPVEMTVNIANVAAAYVSKFAHVSAGCRLTQAEEVSLLEACDSYTSVVQILTQLVTAELEADQLFYAVLGDPYFAFKRGEGEKFLGRIEEHLRERGITVRRQRVLGIWGFLDGKKAAVSTETTCYLHNRKAYLDALRSLDRPDLFLDDSSTTATVLVGGNWTVVVGEKTHTFTLEDTEQGIFEGEQTKVTKNEDDADETVVNVSGKIESLSIEWTVEYAESPVTFRGTLSEDATSVEGKCFDEKGQPMEEFSGTRASSGFDAEDASTAIVQQIASCGKREVGLVNCTVPPRPPLVNWWRARVDCMLDEDVIFPETSVTVDERYVTPHPLEVNQALQTLSLHPVNQDQLDNGSCGGFLMVYQLFLPDHKSLWAKLPYPSSIPEGERAQFLLTSNFNFATFLLQTYEETNNNVVNSALTILSQNPKLCAELPKLEITPEMFASGNFNGGVPDDPLNKIFTHLKNLFQRHRDKIEANWSAEPPPVQEPLTSFRISKEEGNNNSDGNDNLSLKNLTGRVDITNFRCTQRQLQFDPSWLREMFTSFSLDSTDAALSGEDNDEYLQWSAADKQARVDLVAGLELKALGSRPINDFLMTLPGMGKLYTENKTAAGSGDLCFKFHPKDHSYTQTSAAVKYVQALAEDTKYYHTTKMFRKSEWHPRKYVPSSPDQSEYRKLLVYCGEQVWHEDDLRMAINEDGVVKGDAKACLDAEKILSELIVLLEDRKSKDAKFVSLASTLLMAQAHGVKQLRVLSEAWQKAKADGNTQASRENLRSLKREILSCSGQMERPHFHTMVSSVLSDKLHATWKQFTSLSDELVLPLLHVLEFTMLCTSRIGHVRRALEQAHSLRAMIAGARVKGGCLRSPLSQKSEQLCGFLLLSRRYIEPDGQYNPAYLAFEYVQNLVLRPRQYELVESFKQCAIDPASVRNENVKQMIMGQGKTTVISPLLVLALADGERPVVQIMPAPLLAMSREVLRSAFSFAIPKKTYTFACSRSDPLDEVQYKKLKAITESGGVIVSNPTSLKALLLRFVENIVQLQEGTGVKLQSTSQKSKKDETKRIGRILELFRKGTCIIDEVDMVLHPMTSELNFPIENRESLDLSPRRWLLPMHIFKFIFAAWPSDSEEKNARPPKSDRQASFRVAVQSLKAIFGEALKRHKLGTKPHYFLLDIDCYFTKITGDASMLEVVTDWVLLWLQQQHVHLPLDNGPSLEYMKEYLTVRRLTPTPKFEEFFARINNPLLFEDWQRKLLVLARNWLQIYLPHCLQKIDRVSFGLMSPDDYDRFIKLQPQMPESRHKLAIPFVGRDAPSLASEFAQPDIIIGLSLIAYRVELLRMDDIKDLVRVLKAKLATDQGVLYKRPHYKLFSKWIRQAGYVVFDIHEELKGDCVRVPTLDNLKLSNDDEMDVIFTALRSAPSVINYYLSEIIFPKFMKFQKNKLSASAQELGSQMLFRTRLGFSGTPSDLLPRTLGHCKFEPGSQARILLTLTDPKIVNAEYIKAGWSPQSFLEFIAHSPEPFHSLIDSGAMVTGFSNQEVAEFLLKAGHPAEGVVFLDRNDDKKVLVKETLQVINYGECGIPLDKRFAFYDQTHTTGMDIKHAPNARAMLTLGKDMVLRDYSQGAYRMRGIESGQRITLAITPEISRLIRHTVYPRLHVADSKQPPSAELGITSPSDNLTPEERGYCRCVPEKPAERVLEEVVAWLVLNAIRSEEVQFNVLQLQNCDCNFRAVALDRILSEDQGYKEGITIQSVGQAAQFFKEEVKLAVLTSVDKPTGPDSFGGMLKNRWENLDQLVNHIDELDGPLRKERVGAMSHGDATLLQQVLQYFPDVDAPPPDLSSQVENEAEQAQEKESEIEIERFAQLAWSRESEEPSPWKFADLPLEFRPGAQGDIRNNEQGVAIYSAHQKFRLFARPGLELPHDVQFTRNYYDPSWSGARRMKNITMVLEYTKDGEKRNEGITGEMPPQTTKFLEGELNNLLEYVKSRLKHQGAQATNSFPYNTAKKLAERVFPYDMLQKENGKLEISEGELRRQFWTTLRPQDKYRRYLIVSLAEAESIRRIMHSRAGKRNIVDGQTMQMALRCLSGEVNFEERCPSILGSSPDFPHAPKFQWAQALQLLRFLDCQSHFEQRQQVSLIRALQFNSCYARRTFFERINQCKRRLQYEDVTTGVGKKHSHSDLMNVMNSPSEYENARQHAVAIAVGEMLATGQKYLQTGTQDAMCFSLFNALDINSDHRIELRELALLFVFLKAVNYPQFDVSNVDLTEPMLLLRYLDKNEDKLVSSDEFAQGVAELFSAVALDKQELNTEQKLEKLSGRGEIKERMTKYVEQLKQLPSLCDTAQKTEELKRKVEEDAYQSRRTEDYERFKDEIEADFRKRQGENPVVEPGAITYDLQRTRLPRETMDVSSPASTYGFKPDLTARVGGKNYLSVDPKGFCHLAPVESMKKLKPDHLRMIDDYTLTFSFYIPDNETEGKFPQVLLSFPREGEDKLGALLLTPSGDLRFFRGEEMLFCPNRTYVPPLRAADNVNTLKRIGVQRKCWNFITMVVQNSLQRVVLWLNGEVVVNMILSTAFKSSGPFAIDPTLQHGGVVLFGYPAHLLQDKRFSKLYQGGWVRYVRIESKLLCKEEVYQLQIPQGVWRCSPCTCLTRNSPDALTCIVCRWPREKSAVRPEGDADPDHPGLTIVVRDSFNELIMESNKNCLVMSTADWCGPSRELYPYIYRLAHALKDSPDFMIAKIHSDENELDKVLFPENFIPVIKLFLKDRKRTPVTFSGERSYEGLVKFLEETSKVELSSLLTAQFPLYYARQSLHDTFSKMISAIRRDYTDKLSLAQFCSLYFTDPGCYAREQTSTGDVNGLNITFYQIPGPEGTEMGCEFAVQVRGSSTSFPRYLMSRQPVVQLKNERMAKKPVGTGMYRMLGANLFQQMRRPDTGKLSWEPSSTVMSELEDMKPTFWCGPETWYCVKVVELVDILGQPGDILTKKGSVSPEEKVQATGLHYAKNGMEMVLLKGKDSGWVDLSKFKLEEVTVPQVVEVRARRGAGSRPPPPPPPGRLDQELLKELFVTLSAMVRAQPQHASSWLDDYFRCRECTAANEIIPKTFLEPYEIKLREQQLEGLILGQDLEEDRHWEELWAQGLPVDANIFSQTILHRACAQGNLKVVKMLIQRGADMAYPSHTDESVPIEIATQLGHQAIVKELISKKVSVGRAAHIATASNNVELLEFLMDSLGIPYNLRCGGVSLFEFAIEGDCEATLKAVVVRAIKQEAKLTPESLVLSSAVRAKYGCMEGESILHLAARLGRHKAVCVLKNELSTAQWRALVDYQQDSNKDAFSVAVFHIRPLLFDNYSKLWSALARGLKNEVVPQLVGLQIREQLVSIREKRWKNGVVNALNAQGLSPLMFSAIVDEKSIASLLLEQGADPRSRSENKNTVALWAMWASWLREQKKQASQGMVEMFEQQYGTVATEADKQALARLTQIYTQAEEEKDERVLALLDLSPQTSTALGGTPSSALLLLPVLINYAVQKGLNLAGAGMSPAQQSTLLGEIQNKIAAPFLNSYVEYSTVFCNYMDRESEQMNALLTNRGLPPAQTHLSGENLDAPDLETIIAHAKLSQAKMGTELKAVLASIYKNCVCKQSKNELGHELYQYVTNDGEQLALFTDPGIKSKKGIQEKAVKRYGSDYRKIHDASRFAIIFGQVYGLFSALTQLLNPPVRNGQSPYVVQFLENRYLKPTAMGWRDICFNIRVDIGNNKVHCCELQLHLLGYWDVRQHLHDDYEKVRVAVPEVFHVLGDKINTAYDIIIDVITHTDKYRKEYEQPIVQSPVPVYAWESAEEAVDVFLASHPTDKPRKRELITLTCNEIATINLSNRQQQGLYNDNLPETVFVSLRTLAAQEMSHDMKYPPLEQFLRTAFDTLMRHSTGSDMFFNMNILIDSAKLFAQDKVASGSSPLSIEDVFTLFVFGLDSNIQRLTVKAMHSPDTLSSWAPMVWYTQRALAALPPVRGAILFRATNLTKHSTPMTAEDVQNMLNRHPVGEQITWNGFAACSSLLPVAAPWLQQAQLEQSCGVIFKILSCGRARDISPYSYCPWQKEAMFMMGTRFQVTAHMAVNAANLGLVVPQSSLLGRSLETSFVQATKLTAEERKLKPRLAVIELAELP